MARTPEQIERRRAQARERYYKNRDRQQATSRAWKAANRERVRAYMHAYQLKTQYGLTLPQYNALGWTCEICQRIQGPGKRSRLHVDHDHLTGQVRGLLCQSCNLALGTLQDSQVRLRRLLDYLIRYQGNEEQDAQDQAYRARRKEVA